MKKVQAVLAGTASTILCVALGGCSHHTGEHPASKYAAVRFGDSRRSQPGSDMPGWLDLYRKKSVVNVATIDHVVIVTFQTQAVRDGYGVKITLLDSSKNLWSLEYHKQAI